MGATRSVGRGGGGGALSRVPPDAGSRVRRQVPAMIAKTEEETNEPRDVRTTRAPHAS